MSNKVKEYKARCKVCGAAYILQGTKEELEKYLSFFSEYKNYFL